APAGGCVSGQCGGVSPAARLPLNRPALVAGLVLVNTGGFVPQNLLSRTACRMLGTPAVFRRLAPVFVRGYMKPKTDSDRTIAVRACAVAKTQAGVSTGGALGGR